MSDDSLIDGIDEQAPEHILDESKDFKPWHHPRKHWVRINQLCSLSQSLMKQTHFQDETLRYLTLPGDDLMDIHTLASHSEASSSQSELLDIQTLEGALIEKKVKNIKYLGFNKLSKKSSGMSDQNYAESILKDKKTINQSSQVIDERVEDIALEKSRAYELVRKNGPYNIINLDLCGSVANSEPQSKDNTYLNAIVKILELQRENMAQPFVIFITTRTDIASINKESLGIISKIQKENIEEYPEFRTAIEDLLEEEATKILDKLSSEEEVPQEKINHIFGVGLGKWLIKLMRSSQPHWDVTLEDLCCYNVHLGPDMLSLAFKFKKFDGGITDKTGLSKGGTAKPKEPLSEKELAIEMVENSKLIKDVDELLSSDRDAREKVIKQSADLLETIGYERNNYIQFAREKFSKPYQGQAK